MLTRLLQDIIDSFGAVLGGVGDMLPRSPFASVNGIVLENDLLRFIAWLVPFPEILALLKAWIIAVGFYYVYMAILRWVKVLE